MGDICSCYRAVEKRRYVYSVETGQPVDSVTDTVGCCIGTKELDKCTCGGNEAMCDFYPKKQRERVKETECVQQSEVERLSAAYEAALTDLRERAEMIGRLQKARDAAVADMEFIASDSTDDLKCSFCVWNPNDIGCELDGSQFEDGGECHFTWHGVQGGTA